MQLNPNTLLQGGKYRIIRVLGQGGFGITYEARHIQLDGIVAIKEFFMKDCCERDASTGRVSIGSSGLQGLVEKFRGKFIREAQMMRRMDHPHIVRVTDCFEENGSAYYVMDYLPGGSLAEKVKKEGPLSEALAEKYIRQVADALAYIHSKNTVHLDVKPSNILLNERGDAVLIDFGISKHYDSAGEQTSSTPVGISRGFAPLEQGRDDDVSQYGPSTDIYALGATLYNLLTGQVPPEASYVNEYGILQPNGVSDRLWQVIEKSMRPRRQDRPQSITDFLSLIDGKSRCVKVNEDKTVLGARGEGSVPASGVNGARRKTKIKLFAMLAGIALAAIVLAFVLGNIGHGNDPRLSNTEKGHEWVDLGLSVKWATCNVGATSPSDIGIFIAWGETVAKNDYSWSTTRYCNDSKGYSFSKYNTKSGQGTLDNKTRLELSDDAARVSWGGRWRMPTSAEFEELMSNCTFKWTSQDGIDGCLFTSKKNGKSIFLPAAGRKYEKYHDSYGPFGRYWSSSLNRDSPNHAMFLFFSSSSFSTNSYYRYFGLPIRPVLK